MRLFKVFLVAAMFAVIGVGVIHADDEAVVLPMINDGRANYYDIDAPVAVYCIIERPDDDTSNFQRIEVWGLSSNKLLEASAAEIDAVDGAALLDSNWGYTLEKLADGSFKVSAPNGYSFTWERSNQNC
jgi:hypothetical protein